MKEDDKESKLKMEEDIIVFIGEAIGEVEENTVEKMRKERLKEIENV